MSSSISLCMITKNEEKFIDRCLASVKDFVTEIIVVDTGSSDGTVAKVKEWGGKVFHYQWKDNFSQARNFALSFAQGDWILILDADEELENPEEMINVINSYEADGYYITIKNVSTENTLVSEDMVVRLFKNRENYCFYGAIHEQVAGSILAQNKQLRKTSLIINHFGYQKEVIKAKKKFLRNLRIINKAFKTKPEDPFLNYSLAMEYYQAGRLEKGISCLEKAYSRMDGTESYFKDVTIRLILGLLHLEKYSEAINWTNISLGKMPQDAEFNFLRALAEFECGNLQQALQHVYYAAGQPDTQVCPGIICMPFMKDIIKLMLLQLESYTAITKVGNHKSLYFFPIEKQIAKFFTFLLKGEQLQNG